MRTLYIYIPETLADWEPGHVLAELRSGRYSKDPGCGTRSCSAAVPWTPSLPWEDYILHRTS